MTASEGVGGGGQPQGFVCVWGMAVRGGVGSSVAALNSRAPGGGLPWGRRAHREKRCETSPSSRRYTTTEVTPAERSGAGNNYLIVQGCCMTILYHLALPIIKIMHFQGKLSEMFKTYIFILDVRMNSLELNGERKTWAVWIASKLSSAFLLVIGLKD